MILTLIALYYIPALICLISWSYMWRKKESTGHFSQRYKNDHRLSESLIYLGWLLCGIFMIFIIDIKNLFTSKVPSELN